jgi:hypothetical protein
VRDEQLEVDPPDDRPPGGEPPGGGHVRPTTAGVVVGFGLAGLVGGWLIRPLATRLDQTAPVVSWIQVTVLWFVVLILAAAAWGMWRLRQRGVRLEPHRAVNRLVLAKACALVGALVAGGYAGYALAWLGVDAELAEQRMLRSGVAALAGIGMCAAALLLERACRVRKGDDET